MTVHQLLASHPLSSLGMRLAVQYKLVDAMREIHVVRVRSEASP